MGGWVEREERRGEEEERRGEERRGEERRAFPSGVTEACQLHHCELILRFIFAHHHQQIISNLICGS
ncbi:hypothetical protein D4764_03G0012700 [Takifugu flavidus]|uniref:Uncharacterized protein n=1 Tax=Takifugu flavidus TaxID=433684 RepID=A0A5C6N9U8_9TELE|nr:hypothetical protein D4764_03G0012700 [Takifugu flavidus]